jgi:BirA family biotin operon repressor/biotin-[acetyl-CoA-carboxylase] ligase
MGGTPGFVVVGVGINVRHEPDDFPPELRGAAISLRIASGGDAPLLDVAGRVVPALRACLLGPLAITPAILSALAERDLLRGRAIAVSDPATATERGRGTAAGIAEDGALLLREPSGAVRPIHAGTVRLINDLTADP